jgi:hypothetical protein
MGLKEGGGRGWVGENSGIMKRYSTHTNDANDTNGAGSIYSNYFVAIFRSFFSSGRCRLG